MTTLSALQFTWVDTVILVVLAYGAWHGLLRGFVGLLFQFVALIATLVVTLTFFPRVSDFLEHTVHVPVDWVKPFALLVTFVVAFIIINYIVNLVQKLFNPIVRASAINRILGILMGIAWEAVLIGVVLAILITLPLTSFIRPVLSQSILATPMINGALALDRTIEHYVDPNTLGTLAVILDNGQAATSAALNFTDANPTVDQQGELNLLTATNAIRLSQNLPQLAMDNQLQNVARAHAIDMLQKDYFSHTSRDNKTLTDRLAKANITVLSSGENLAFAPTVEIAQAGLLASNGHRANILNSRFTTVGIAVLDAGSHGKMIVEDFAQE